MGRGLGMALLSVGSGLDAYAARLAQQQAAQAQQDRTMGLQGFFRRTTPKAPLPRPEGAMMPMDDGDGPDSEGPRDVLEDAVGHGPSPMGMMGLGRTVMGIPAPGAAAPQASTVVAPSEKAAVTASFDTQPKEHAVTASFGGQTYDVRPELSEQGQAMTLQRALKEPGNRAAYMAWTRRHPDQRVGYESVGDWQSVLAQDVNREARTAPDPETNRRYFDTVNHALGGKLQYIPDHDYKSAYDRYVSGEESQQNRAEFRVMFPPNSGGGSDGAGGPKGHDEATQSAVAALQNIARANLQAQRPGPVVNPQEFSATLSRFPAAQRDQVEAGVRHFLEEVRRQGAQSSYQR